MLETPAERQWLNDPLTSPQVVIHCRECKAVTSSVFRVLKTPPEIKCKINNHVEFNK